jgi:hypothetical protein
VQQPAVAQPHDPNAIVLELRYEHLFTRRIEREMIDATVNLPERDLAFQFEKSRKILLRDAPASDYVKR